MKRKKKKKQRRKNAKKKGVRRSQGTWRMLGDNLQMVHFYIIYTVVQGALGSEQPESESEEEWGGEGLGRAREM